MSDYTTVISNVKSSIRYYEGRGVELSPNPGRCVLPKTCGQNSTKRSAISGWSAQSRYRFRRSLLVCKPPENLRPWGVTCTIPGPTLPPETAKYAFSRFTVLLRRSGFEHCGWWRMEVQQRGALHWHCIVWCRPLAQSGFVPLYGRRFEQPPGTSPKVVLNHCWWAALDLLPPVDGVPRSLLPGAWYHACDSSPVPESTNQGAIMRYLADHASKTKQAQIASNCGRHWGALVPASMGEQSPSGVAVLDDVQWYRFLRTVQRLATPRRKKDCVFGSCLGRRCRRGSRGRSTWFSRPDSIARLVEWAADSPPF